MNNKIFIFPHHSHVDKSIRTQSPFAFVFAHSGSRKVDKKSSYTFSRRNMPDGDVHLFSLVVNRHIRRLVNFGRLQN